MAGADGGSRAATLRADAMLTPSGALANAEIEIDAAGWIAYAGTARPGSTPTHDLTGHVLMPGLVNGHTHSAMTLMRGSSDDAGLGPWLDTVQAAEQRLTRDDVEAGLELAMLEMIATGTTAFADMYYWDAGLLATVRDAGMRVRAAVNVFTPDQVAFPGVSPLTGAASLDATEALAREFASDLQIEVAFGPHAPYTTTPAQLHEIAERSIRTGIPLQIHVAETASEVAAVVAEHGMRPGLYLDSLGVLEADVLVAHGVHLAPEEIALFARTGTAVSHNPVSNLKLGCGVAPLPDMLAAGVRLALGSDSAASNNSLDLFEEIKLAAILHRGVREDAAAVRGVDTLHMATRGGAEAIGFPDTGALEAGRLADIIALDITGSTAAPHDSLTSHLAFGARGSDVRHVFIGGRHVYANGEHLTLDAERVIARAREAATRVRAASA